MIAFLQHQPLLSLFLIVTLGYFIGQIKIKGFSLESSAILFVAMIAGHVGLILPSDFKTFGLVLFIYAIGLQAGPSFFAFFRKDGLLLNLYAILIVSIGAILTFLYILIFHFDPAISIGLFAGALTSTPGLAAAQEATGSNLTSIGYGIAYPFGVIGVMLFVKILPMLFKQSFNEAEQAEVSNQSDEAAELKYQHNQVKNPAIFGKSLKDLHFRITTGCVISRIMRGDHIIIPRGDTVLESGDLVRVVGRKEDLIRATNLLGALSNETIPQEKLDVRRFVVTNKKIIGKTLKQLSINSFYNANVTRIRRSGMEFPALPSQRLEIGDRLTVVGEQSAMQELKEFFGDDIKLLEEGNVYSIILGIAIGILVGLIPVSIGNLISLKMGISGGILLSGLLLSNIGKTGPIIWRAPGPIVSFIRELGLTLFLAVIGVNAGAHFVEILSQKGVGLVAAGALITVLPMVIIVLVNRIQKKFNMLQLSGLITGGMTSTPGLASITSVSSSGTPMMIYASVYPLAMICMMLWAKFLALLF